MTLSYYLPKMVNSVLFFLHHLSVKKCSILNEMSDRIKYFNFLGPTYFPMIYQWSKDHLSPYLRSVFPALLRNIKKIRTTKTYHKLNIDTKQTTFKVDK